MLHIVINLYPGRSDAIKRSMAGAVQKTFVQELGFAPSDISVAVREIPAERFVKQIQEDCQKQEVLIASAYISETQGGNGTTNA